MQSEKVEILRKPLHCLYFVLKTSSAIMCLCHYYIRLKIALSDQFPFKKRPNVMTDRWTTLTATMFRWELKLPGCCQCLLSNDIISSVHEDLSTTFFFYSSQWFYPDTLFDQTLAFFLFFQISIILARLSAAVLYILCWLLHLCLPLVITHAVWAHVLRSCFW